MLCTAQAAMRLHLARVYCSIEAYLLVLAAALPVGRLNHKLHREDVSQLGTIAIPSTCDLRQRYTLSAESRGSCPSRMLCSAQACPTVRPEGAASGRAKGCIYSQLALPIQQAVRPRCIRRTSGCDVCSIRSQQGSARSSLTFSSASL